jgi:FkbM family methyltransferase
MLAFPILRGDLAGCRYGLKSGGKLLRVLLGTYEPEQTAQFRRRLRPGHTLFDVGAHVGYYSMLGASLVGSAGRVHAFEPQPRNAGYLRGHLALNRFSNVTVTETAISDRPGTASFAPGTGSGTGRLSGSGGEEVKTTTLDHYTRETGAEPDVMKIDVEGAEVAVLEGARHLLEARRPVIFLSTHGDAVRQRCLEILARAGYACEPLLPGESAEFVCSARD